VPALVRLLRDRGSWVSTVARRFGRLIRARIVTPAFHPNAAQRVLEGHPQVFAVLRAAADGSRVLAVTNVSDREQAYSCPREVLGTDAREWQDLVSRRIVPATPSGIEVVLGPYGVLWLAPNR
jgi:sucrose phosphorylase